MGKQPAAKQLETAAQRPWERTEAYYRIQPKEGLVCPEESWAFLPPKNQTPMGHLLPTAQGPLQPKEVESL